MTVAASFARRARDARPMLVLFVLALLHTWPLSVSPRTRSLNGNADAELNAWIVSWIAHAVVTQPAHLFDANIFAPERDVLAYSEPLIVPGLAAAPLRWLGASPVLTFNVLLVAGLTLTACCGWLVAWRWTGSSTAGVVAGALVAFNAHLLTRLPHLQAAHLWGLALVVLLADRLIDRPSRTATIGLAVVVAAIAATSLYELALAVVAVAVFVAASLRQPQRTLRLLGGTALGLALAAPVLWPYARLAASGASRPLEMVAQFSATPAGYLTSQSLVDRGWSRVFFTTDVNVLFAGFVALTLAAIGAVTAIRDGQTSRRRALVLIAIGVSGVVLSLGPATFVYRVLYAWVPPVRGLRAAARFGYLYLFAVALLAAWGVAAIERWRPAIRPWKIAAVLLVLVTAEAWQGPVATQAFTGIPRIYSLLADRHVPVRLVEVPFYPPDAVFENGEYVLDSTAHWQPIMNGYSGVTPDSYRRRAARFWFFPEDWAIQAIEREGATDVMVHLDRFGPDADRVARALDHRPDLRFVASDSGGRRLYHVVSPAGAASGSSVGAAGAGRR